MDTFYIVFLFVCCIICWLYWSTDFLVFGRKKSKGHINKNGDHFPEEKETTANETVTDVISNSNFKTMGVFPSSYETLRQQSFANQIASQLRVDEARQVLMTRISSDVRWNLPENPINEIPKQDEKPAVTKEQLTERLVKAKRKIQLDDNNE